MAFNAVSSVSDQLKGYLPMGQVFLKAAAADAVLREKWEAEQNAANIAAKKAGERAKKIPRPEYQATADMRVNCSVTLWLSSGKECTGIVADVGYHFVVLEWLSGREYYGVRLSIKDIIGISVRTRNNPFLSPVGPASASCV